MSDPAWMSVAEIGQAYANKTLSPVELVQALFARIDRLEPQINAFVLPDPEAALAAARQAESEIMAGRSRGPLHGVPVGVKDIIDVAGVPTTCHSKILAGNTATADAHVVALLRNAGAIVMGKLSTWEFAIGGPSFDLPTPPARNPWNRNHHPGGSSSGSGAGLAAGMFPLALGTDTGGSVRNPASCCGIVGLKPTYGLVSRRGVFPLSFTMDHVGPMGRSAADVAAMLAVIAGYDPADPGSTPGPLLSTTGLDRGVKGLRIGFVRHFHDADLIADPEVAAGLEGVAEALAGQGAEIRTVTLPPLREFIAVNRTIQYCEAFAIHGQWLRQRPGDYALATRQRLMTGAFIGGADYVQAQRHRLSLIAAVNSAFQDVDVLLCASSLDPACVIDDQDAIGHTFSRQARMPFNVTGHPALAMMSGLSKSGLPLSVQFVAPAYADARLLQLAASYEQVAPWRGLRPSLAA